VTLDLEEAAEIVLNGESWVLCPDCLGNRHIRKETVEVGDPIYLSPDGVGYTVKTCPLCKGYGGAINVLYEEACGLLNKPCLARSPGVYVQSPIGRVVGKSPEPGAYEVQVSPVYDEAVFGGPRGTYVLRINEP
jgi:hypothetical protein